jgi:DNA-binding CsgD family transcriptional regulator/PAS domain-containing protein
MNSTEARIQRLKAFGKKASFARSAQRTGTVGSETGVMSQKITYQTTKRCILLNITNMNPYVMEKLILNEAEKIWKEIGHYKKPKELKLEIEIYKKMLNFFQVGDFCYFIFSPPEMRMEYTNSSIISLLGYAPEEFILEKFLEVIHPDDLNRYLNFEATITEFWKSLPPEKVLKYKTRYDFRIRCKDGEYKRLLQQVMVIQSDEEGAVLRTFVIFTDISHLKQNNKMVLSIIGMEGEPSYIDIQPIMKLVAFKEMLTRREKEIFQLLVRDMTSKEIAGTLNISAATVSNHRKNIFGKTNTTSVLQLLQLGLDKGWI